MSCRPSSTNRRSRSWSSIDASESSRRTRLKERGEKWPMITAYDALTARLFDEAGIPALLVGDSAAMVVYGHDSTLPVTVDELVVTSDSSAYALTRSEGTQTVLATDTTSAEANREMFQFARESGEWKISRYMFNKAS